MIANTNFDFFKINNQMIHDYFNFSFVVFHLGLFIHLLFYFKPDFSMNNDCKYEFGF